MTLGATVCITLCGGACNITSGPSAVAPPTAAVVGTSADSSGELAATTDSSGELAATTPPQVPRSAGTTATPAGAGVHILELFTSQGCSSCPPADSLLAELSQQPNILPLSFHVDYWNYLGWADPFSQATWSERQQAYALHLGERGVYTPQLIIDGRVGMVGSNRRDVARLLAAADATTPKVLAATATWTAASVRVAVTAPSNATVWLALYDHSTRVAVPRGENAGATLQTTNPVRTLQRIAEPGKQVTATIALPASCKDCNAVAFTQDATTPGPIMAAINLSAP